MAHMLSSAADELPRDVADDHVDGLLRLDPILATHLGVPGGARCLPDLSPDGAEARAALARTTLRQLAAAETRPGANTDDERRCGRLLRERLTAELAIHDAGEHLRAVSNLRSPVHNIREVFTLMPVETAEDHADMAARLRAVPAALDGCRASLDKGLAAGLPAGPRQVDAVITQIGQWIGGGARSSWFRGLVDGGPQELRAELDAAAARATGAFATLRDWLRDTYAPAVEGAPDIVGDERYARWVRFWNGTESDLAEAYAYGWSEFHRLRADMTAEAARILPGATPWQVLRHLAEHGRAIHGVEEVRRWLQKLTDEVTADLDGTHFDLAERIKRIEVRIAPPGRAAAPYYTAPSEDFRRPGRTWLPTMGRTRFPVFDLVSTWCHEGVPGHHLQLARWAHVAGRLSRYQATSGLVSANTEGWAMYAERFMDELGFYADPEWRMGHLDGQMMRANRVIVDIGMHLRLRIPADSPFHPGERWTPELAKAFVGAHTGRTADFVDSELVRYLGRPGQAIGYKLGERAWLAGRSAARSARGGAFDLKAWHMAALSLGSLGLDDLVEEISAL
ncbi:hypothetical protein ADL00_39865 [Streptomyces sp. AS58]|uniref:DUF885 domain-containing protein n=1 Tax=Streptomyces sp. AS58 TaxID=1519489 RepID=UPI0006AEDE58|nr:DUF885 domain-containing protein [Streptomyces sp. AS58]KOV51750.1 hypothetical protein ADL00_39865 [Streptomyces sp. AS58]